MMTKRPTMLWTLFMLFLLTTQIEDSEAKMSFKLKKMLKKVLLLKALTGKKGMTIIPIPIPLNLMKDMMTDDMEMDDLKMKMPEAMMSMPMHMPMHMPVHMPVPAMQMPYPLLPPPLNARVVGYEVIVPKDDERNILPQRGMVQSQGHPGKQQAMMQGGKYGMMMRNDE